MVFSSVEFIAFFLVIAVAVYYNPFVRTRGFKNIWLTIVSLFFYAWGEPYFVFLLMGSILLNYLSGLLIDRFSEDRIKKRAVFILAVGLNLSILVFFKYLPFILYNAGKLIHSAPQLSLALPIGISFYTFQSISYLADLYRGKVSVQKNLIHLALYIAMFPQLIAGPIVRYEDISKELTGRSESTDNVVRGLFRFIFGLGKKILIADQVALLADVVFAGEGSSVASAWLGSVAYTLQIYFDFSGYSDMAIGLGLMFGFHISENFNYPYISASVTEFWRRWHISLSGWFRDYVYIPLGGNRVKPLRHIFNLFVVWFLTGLWHGANWTFILWGLLYFVILTVEKTLSKTKLSLPSWLKHLYTLLIVNFLWVLFRSESISHALRYWGRMFGIGASGFMDAAALNYLSSYKLWLCLGMVCCLPVFKGVTQSFGSNAAGRVNAVLAVLIFVLSFAFVLSGGYDPFIYYNF